MGEAPAARLRRWPAAPLAFVALAVGISWAAWALVLAVPANPPIDRVRLVQGLLFAGGFGPVVAALVLVWARGESLRAWALARLRPPRLPRLYALALGGPLALHAGTVVAVDALGGPITVDPNLDALVLWLPVLVVHHSLWAGGNEELGWRGWLQEHLGARVGLGPAAVGIGVLWGLWHLPLFVLPTGLYEKQAFGAFLLTAVALGVLIALLYDAGDGAVLPAMLFHGAWNALDPLRPIPVWTLQEAGWSIESRAEVLVCWLAVALVLGWRAWRRRPAGQSGS